jgi:hypothetical protein
VDDQKDLRNGPIERLSRIEMWLNKYRYRKGSESVREITIENEDLHPISHVSFDVGGMDLSHKAVTSEV